jgi:hypothetical protein
VSVGLGALRRQRRGAAVVAAALGDMRPAIDENPEGVLSGEWPENFSLVSYEDLRKYLESQIVSTDKVTFHFFSCSFFPSSFGRDSLV